MSGGSYDYLFSKMEDACDILDKSTDPLRRIFSEKMRLYAKAMHDIEWLGVNFMTWISVSKKLPEIFQRVEVLAWEFGQPIEHIAAEFWQSSEPNQPPKFYFDEETYQLDCPCLISSKVHFWKPRDT